jgi:hypothetical protein
MGIPAQGLFMKKRAVKNRSSLQACAETFIVSLYFQKIETNEFMNEAKR